MIDIPELGDDHHEAWTLLMELTADAPAPWTLIGAHMVLLHLWSHGSDIQRATQDADILVDIRAVADGTEAISRTLVERGLELAPVSPGGIGHRFVRGGVQIDVLAPDGTGSRANVTTIRPNRTVRVPGGIAALNRTLAHPVRSRGISGKVYAPDLLGALVVTVRAIAVDDAPRDKRRDATLLLSVVDDPAPLVEAISPRERAHLRSHPYFADPSDPSWEGAPRPDLGASVYARLADL